MYQCDTKCFCNYTITLGLLERPNDMKITSVGSALIKRVGGFVFGWCSGFFKDTRRILEGKENED